MIHVIAIVGLAILCGVWVVVMRASGDTINAGRCGACGLRDGEPNDGTCHGSGGPNCRNAVQETSPEGKADQA